MVGTAAAAGGGTLAGVGAFFCCGIVVVFGVADDAAEERLAAPVPVGLVVAAGLEADEAAAALVGTDGVDVDIDVVIGFFVAGVAAGPGVLCFSFADDLFVAGVLLLAAGAAAAPGVAVVSAVSAADLTEGLFAVDDALSLSLVLDACGPGSDLRRL